MNDQDNIIAHQLNQSIQLLKDVFGPHLLSVYLYGSSIVGGLQKHSDLDLVVVLERPTSANEKQVLVNRLLQISGLYMKSLKLPIELTVVVQSEINPWRYPPHFDFQYGEWLRVQFENGIIEPWPDKQMPDLALLITQVHLASKTLFGPNPDQLLAPVPYCDFILATKDVLIHLMNDLQADIRNVLLTYARIWKTLETNTICSKPTAADWAIIRLPEAYQRVLGRARSICVGEINECWDDILYLVQPCADFMLTEIEKLFLKIDSTGYENKSILFNSAEP